MNKTCVFCWQGRFLFPYTHCAPARTVSNGVARYQHLQVRLSLTRPDSGIQDLLPLLRGMYKKEKEFNEEIHFAYELCGDQTRLPFLAGSNIEKRIVPAGLHYMNELLTSIQAFVDGSEGGFQFTKQRRQRVSLMVCCSIVALSFVVQIHPVAKAGSTLCSILWGKTPPSLSGPGFLYL